MADKRKPSDYIRHAVIFQRDLFELAKTKARVYLWLTGYEPKVYDIPAENFLEALDKAKAIYAKELGLDALLASKP